MPYPVELNDKTPEQAALQKKRDRLRRVDKCRVCRFPLTNQRAMMDHVGCKDSPISDERLLELLEFI